MDTQLRGINVPSPRFRLAPMADDLCHVKGFKSLQTFFPTLSKLYRITKHQSEGVWLDSKLRIVGIDISGTSGPCSLSVVPNVDVSGAAESVVNSRSMDIPAFMKVTHLLDPVRWMKGTYSLPKQSGLPWHHKTWTTACTKIQDQWNQAYVETVASYALGRLRDEGISPHFNEFYGAFCSRAEIYRYNLTDEFGSFRNARWFWHGQKKGLYKLCMLDTRDPSHPVAKEIVDEFLREPSETHSESSESSADEEEVLIEEGDIAACEVKSLHSDAMSELSFAPEEEVEEVEEAEEAEEAEGTISEDVSEGISDDTDIPDDNYKIYAEIHDFPVMLIALEQNRGTMDSLLDDAAAVGAMHGTPEWELRWSAWLFQVLAALSVAQSILGFTHNDLHTNNIVWTETSEEYMYYTLRSGAVFKVPTFGKLFRVIDFGRAIFTINGRQFISDDFRAGNDADGQYCFKPLHPRPTVEIPPNPSFDLCRLAVSLFEALYPDAPADKEGGAIMSSEEGLEMTETVSPLYNCIWGWMIDDEGRNVLVEANGDERFPDFDLYKHIAAKIHKAIPAQQFQHAAFDRFQVRPSDVAKDTKVWQLFA